MFYHMIKELLLFQKWPEYEMYQKNQMAYTYQKFL